MSRIPRTPVHWPRMKVRGRRNRAKLADRLTHRMVIPFAKIERQAHLGMYSLTFTAIAEYADGAYRIEHERVTDGFGRPVGTPKTVAKPAEDPLGPDGWLLRVMGISRETYDLITGKERLHVPRADDDPTAAPAA